MMKKCCRPIWATKSGKLVRPKIRFSQIWFLGRKIFLCQKSDQYPNSNSPLFGPIVENILEVLHDDIANLARGKKLVLSFWDPNIDWFPVGPFGLTFVKNDWLGVWPPCQMMKKCCWWIWAPKSGKKFRPKNDFPKFVFFCRKTFCLKKNHFLPRAKLAISSWKTSNTFFDNRAK